LAPCEVAGEEEVADEELVDMLTPFGVTGEEAAVGVLAPCEVAGEEEVADEELVGILCGTSVKRYASVFIRVYGSRLYIPVKH
jgi:hypothetical protein